MATATILGYDVTHTFINTVPHDGKPVAGYTTGSPDIRWSDTDWGAHPGALRIDQDFNAADPSADYLDVENGAATPADCPRWAKQAWADWHTAKRPGQRAPAVYMSQDNVTTVVNALIAGGVTADVGLVVANYNLSQAQATTMVANGGGPFPIIGVQFSDQGGGGTYDFDVFSVPWLEHVSGNSSVYGAPRNLHASPGLHSVKLTWAVPGTPGLPNPSNYRVYMYNGTVTNKSTMIPSYPPRIVGAITTYQGGSLTPGKEYTAHVAASGPAGSHVAPGVYASVSFRTT